MKAMKFFLATSAVVALAFAACQKQDASSPISGEVSVAAQSAQDNTFSQGADHVRWDIIHFNAGTTPPKVSAGGVAYAKAITGNALSPEMRIKLTGSGTFVAPPGGGTSGAVTGGGTWETFRSGVSTGSGTYTVTKLVSWVFANLQPPVITDLIGGPNEKGANGTAVLVIKYSDGSLGTLGIGCHGPGAPDGIEEGVIATKGYVTYWTGEVPGGSVDANRTSFHVRQKTMSSEEED